MDNIIKLINKQTHSTKGLKMKTYTIIILFLITTNILGKPLDKEDTVFICNHFNKIYEWTREDKDGNLFPEKVQDDFRISTKDISMTFKEVKEICRLEYSTNKNDK